ncbi:acyltransferase [Psychroflexus aestuariivivens]|uniref:acyltransferase n=1 Tax=Psychroflexus aestuariivivens TaxID=1795040 RepID=UPI000FDCA8B6|nr:acyltransferase [Psychroflexus aestuariivivens]
MLKSIKKTRNKLKKFYWTAKAKKKVKQYNGEIHVNGKSYFSSKTTLGNNVHFNGIKVIGNGKVSIGDNFHSGWGVVLLTHYHNYKSKQSIPYDNTYIVRDIIIEDNVWFGINITVMAGVTIGEGAIIQAGSVVVNDIPAYSIAGGHPAKVFSKRDVESYQILKNEGKFF